MMKLADVKTKAKLVGIANPSSDRSELIRQIQTYEGFSPCFKTKAKCDQMKCSWRDECIKK
jgi:hypothetical protein